MSVSTGRPCAPSVAAIAVTHKHDACPLRFGDNPFHDLGASGVWSVRAAATKSKGFGDAIWCLEAANDVGLRVTTSAYENHEGI